MKTIEELTDTAQRIYRHIEHGDMNAAVKELQDIETQSQAPTEVLMEDFFVIREMIRSGGGFASSLGRSAQAADDTNLRRIKETWPDYWKKYSNLARIAEDEQRRLGLV